MIWLCESSGRELALGAAFPQSGNRYAYVCAGTNRRKGEDERASPGKRGAPRPDLEFCGARREARVEA